MSGNGSLTADPASPGRACFPQIATRTPGGNRAVGDARDFAVATVRRWGAGHLCEDVAVIVSELVTNALRHAAPADGESRRGRPVQVGLLRPGPRVLLCAVADPSRRPPALREPDPLAESGRGLHVVAALSHTWGYTPLGDPGKVVWTLLSTAPCWHL